MSNVATSLLPATVRPIKYEVTLSPDLVACTFTGEETIDIEVRQSTAQIVLNAAELEIHEASLLRNGQQLPAERIDLFDFLSLRFAITTLLSMLALGTHAFLLYRQRFIQLGIMRAIGLSARQVAATLAGEQMLATLLSIVGGGAMGLLTSHLFIPFMQIGRAETDLVPPYIVIIDWQSAAYLVLALGMAALAITGGVIWTLSRLRLFQAIKLGETIG